MSFLNITELSKSYGTLKAVDRFNLGLSKGEIGSLAGPDGAGKTTIMRSICNLIEFEAGEIIIDGHNSINESDKIKLKLGYMPQQFSLYPDLTVEENLIFYGGIHNVTGKLFHQRSDELYNFSNLKPFKKRRAQALSGGMKQKLALSCALIHQPELLLLDEPTTGVDPLSRRQFWEILLDLKKQGVTILVSTPYMDEVARSDKTIFLFEGCKLAEGKPAEINQLFEGQIFYIDKIPTQSELNQLNQIEQLKARRFGAGMHLYLNADDNVMNLSHDLNKLSLDVEKIKKVKPGLEDCFIQMMERS